MRIAMGRGKGVAGQPAENPASCRETRSVGVVSGFIPPRRAGTAFWTKSHVSLANSHEQVPTVRPPVQRLSLHGAGLESILELLVTFSEALHPRFWHFATRCPRGVKGLIIEYSASSALHITGLSHASASNVCQIGTLAASQNPQVAMQAPVAFFFLLLLVLQVTSVAGL
jgi:hypothetical protein